MALELELFLKNPGLSQICEIILWYLDPWTLANFRQASKKWKHFIDNTRKLLLLQIKQMLNTRKLIPYNTRLLLRVTTILMKWPQMIEVFKYLQKQGTSDRRFTTSLFVTR